MNALFLLLLTTSCLTANESLSALKNRLQPETGYVRSFSGVRYKSMRLTSDIAFEDGAMAFIDGYSFAKHIFSKQLMREQFTFILSQDPRPTSPSILKYQVKGMLKAAKEEGKILELITLGVATTPFWESAIREFKADGGIMITASHNPLNENGWKYAGSYKTGGSLLEPEEMGRVLTSSQTYIEQVLAGKINLTAIMNTISDEEATLYYHPEQFERALSAYVKEQAPLVEGCDRSIRVIHDSNGGAASKVNRLVLERLGFYNVIYLNTDLGKPAHKIEPIKGKKGEEHDRSKNGLIDVTKALQETGAKVAIVYDFDADRGNLVLLDAEHKVDEISPQDVAAFNVAMSLLPYRHQKVAVVGHCATSGRTKEIATLLGAEMKTVEVGEVNVTKKMTLLEKEGYLVPIGVEGYNGGTIFRGSQCRDGLQTLLMSMKALSNPHFFYSWLDAKGETPSNSLLKRISEGNFYLTDFIDRLPRFVSLQDKKTGIHLNQKEFKIALEKALLEKIPLLQHEGGHYRSFFIEYISETDVRSRQVTPTTQPGEGLDGSFIEGGWRVRFIKENGEESMIWMRGSKTENGTYRTLIDAQSEKEADALKFLIQ